MSTALVPSYELSPQQQGVIEFVKSPGIEVAAEIYRNAIIEAVAGAGKTTTLVEIAKHIKGSAAFVAFNKKIADEIGMKLVKAGAKNVKAATFHSYGFTAWRMVSPKVKMEGEQKIERIMAEAGVPNHLKAFTKRLVSLAKQEAMGCLERPSINDILYYRDLVDHHDMEETLYNEWNPDTGKSVEQGIEWAIQILKRSNDDCPRSIDFDDMIYAPLLFNAKFIKYDWVLVDEAQDTNAARRMMAKAMLKPQGRLIAVGDPRQAIYGFTGANADALDLIEEEFDCARLPLTITYRCPKAVVRHAQQWVSHIESAPTAPEGEVRQMYEADFRKVVPAPSDAILCRNTRPLIELALGFIRRRIPAHVEGRDIGQSLMTLVRKWKSVQTVDDLREKLEEFRVHEIIRLTEKNQEAKIDALNDRVGSLNCIMDTLHDDDSINDLAKVIQDIFKDTEGNDKESITLSTVHKAKGREWDTVYLYGRNAFMPSPYAKQTWQIEQEHNLIYVAVTRAKKTLIEVRMGGTVNDELGPEDLGGIS